MTTELFFLLLSSDESVSAGFASKLGSVERMLNSNRRRMKKMALTMRFFEKITPFRSI